MRNFSNRFAVVATGFSVAAAMALSPSAASASDISWLIAAGVSARPDYEGSDTHEAFPIGTFRASLSSGEYVELVGARSSGSAARLAINLVDSSQFNFLEFGPILQYRLERDDVDSNAVEALGKVDSAIEAGGFATFKTESFSIGASGAQVVTNENDGFTVELYTEYTVRPTDTWSLTSGLASTYASNDYQNAYFTVTAAGAAASGLTQYNSGAGFKDVGLRFSTAWAGPGSGWEHLRLMGLVSWFHMLGDAEDSPVVDDEGDASQFFGGIAIGWQS
jgi:outer membrane protein